MSKETHRTTWIRERCAVVVVRFIPVPAKGGWRPRTEPPARLELLPRWSVPSRIDHDQAFAMALGRIAARRLGAQRAA
jgi:hypothetical protein